MRVFFLSMFFSLFATIRLFLQDERGEVGVPDLGGDDPPVDPPNDPPVDPPSGDVFWPEGLDETYRNEGMFKPFIDDKKNIDVVKLAKSYYHTKKDMGKDKITVPNQNTTPEEWDGIYEKLFGVSPKIENYVLDLGEEAKKNFDESFIEGFKKVSHELRLPADKAKKIAEFFNKEVDSTLEGASLAEKNALNEEWAKIKNEWGDAYQQRVTVGQRFIDENASEDMKKYLKESGLGKNPKLYHFLAEFASKYYAEGQVPKDPIVGGEILTPAQAQKEINEIMGNKDHPYHKGKNDPRYKDAVARMKQLHVWKSKKS